MSGVDFPVLLNIGGAAENIVREFFINQGAEVEKVEGLFEAYDLLVTFNDEQGTKHMTSIEVKSDRYAKTSKNILIEADKVENGVTVPSGLTTTKADWYAIVIWGMKGIHFIKVDLLKKFVAEHLYKDKWLVGNNNNSINYVFDRDEFIKHCHTEQKDKLNILPMNVKTDSKATIQERKPNDGSPQTV